MKSSDRTILLGIALLGLLAAFWFLILSPKRQEASDLQTQVTELETEVTAAEQIAATGRAAKKDFPQNYETLISLGKAAPVDADTPSLLTQLQTLSTESKVDFRSITLSGATAEAAPPPAPVTSDGSTTTEPAAATEATAALLPIGATVGSAGLPVMPYEMQFEGGFFNIADFFGRIDGMVESDGERTTVDGRLLTIDGFTLVPSTTGFPHLSANVTTTSYLTPADQGVTAGATPAGPAAATPVAGATQTAPATPAPTATVAP
jgi:hypothetical protein